MASFDIENVVYVPFTQKNGEKLKFAHVGWLPRLNVRKNYGSERELEKTRNALAGFGGWDAQYPAIGEVATEQEVNELLEHRRKIWQRYKDNAGAEKADQYDRNKLRAFELHYCETRKKSVELVHPIILGTTGNRRGSQLDDVLTILHEERESAGKADAWEASAVHDYIYVIVPNTGDHRFPDAGVRTQAQIRENSTKTEGFKPMSDQENLAATLDLVENSGKSQSEVRKTFGESNPGYGLRLYFAVIIDIFCRMKKMKKVNFLARLLAPQYFDKSGSANDANGKRYEGLPEGGKMNPEFLDFRMFKQTTFQGEKEGDFENVPVGLMCEFQDKFDKENKRRANLKKDKLDPITRPNEDFLLKWIDHVKEGGTPTPPLLKRATINTLSEAFGVIPARLGFKAVRNNDTTITAALVPRKEGYNYIHEMSDSAYEYADKIVIGLKDLDDDTQIALLSHFAGMVEEAVATATPSAENPEVPTSTEGSVV